MSIASNELEARALIEATGYYDDAESIMEAWRTLARHIGWQDRRRDKRFVVKFHDITPDMSDNEFDSLFETFCNDMFDDVVSTVDDYTPLVTRMPVGHYPAMVLDIPEITEDNIVSLAMQAYDEFPYDTSQYIEDHITLVDAMQYLEDTYLTQWQEFIEENKWKN